ncbi:MAG: glycoside hydrolase family 125 protein [Bacteroidales bacterium]|nr:glycoside hydrolase family 125 protein [Bacteroidales bacterium]
MKNRKTYLLGGCCAAFVAIALILFSCGRDTRVGHQAVEIPRALIDAHPVPNLVSQRPAERLFTSPAVEKTILEVQAQLTNPTLSWMFGNCFPNTLDTTVHYREDEQGNPETFVYTGDIHAMWLRDSGAQVWPYVRLCAGDEALRKLIAGVINQQFKLIVLDPYANAFNDGPTGGEWMSDNTQMRPEVHERKWEIDSHCYPIRLAHAYWKQTGDVSVFGPCWIEAVKLTLKTFREQQRFGGHGPYYFQRHTERQLDTKCCNGMGAPVKPCGLIASSFRPSDDATTYEFLIPSNFFAVSALRKAAEILLAVNHQGSMAEDCLNLASEVSAALKEHAVKEHPVYGKIYAFEVDGFGNALLMDDANAPSLLSLPYLCDVPADDPVYLNTRAFVWSGSNPYFFKGKMAEGIGGPHIGYDMAWPMSLIIKALTSDVDDEIKSCVEMLMLTDAGTGFMHESFHVDDPNVYTRPWFAWQNTLFGELILDLIERGKLDLLNSIKL